MIINDKEYGDFGVYLSDDGTLDTVISVYPYTVGFPDEQEIRFSQEHASLCRDETGAMTEEGFKELAEEAVEAYIEQYLV